MSLRGYCRTARVRIDCTPAIRMIRLTTIARTGRLTKRSVNFMSVVLGPRRGAVARLRLVVHQDGRAVSQLEGARGHDLRAGGDARQDRDLIPARAAELDHLLPDPFVAGAGRSLHLFDDVDRIAVRRVADRGGGQDDAALLGVEVRADGDE